MEFTTPKEEKVYSVTVENFTGIDLRNAPSKCSPNRSPMCPNLIREAKGVNRKRYGYETVFTLSGNINGLHVLRGTEDKVLIHAGEKMYLADLEAGTTTLLYSAAADAISESQQINGKLYILDGSNFLVFDGTTVTDVSDSAYIPVIIIARTYEGGGTLLEPVNLLSAKRTEKFTGDSEHTTFQLTATGIDADTVTVKSLQADGSLVDLVENTDFAVNRTLGTVTFSSVKPTPVTGVDNLYITYAKTVSGYADRIKKCDVSILYGMNGRRDRIFVAGNPDYGNYDWYSASGDPTYFGDTWYCVVGQDSSRIMGYSIINDYLATHKDIVENGSNINLRSGSYVSNTVVFASAGSFPAAGAIAKRGFASFDNEPLYITTDRNVSAITATDVVGERMSQERSYYISTALADEDLENAFAVYHQGFYCLACRDVGTEPGKMYLIDSTQPVYERNTPYSNRQYECYMFTGIGARVLWSYNGVLWFGTSDGKVKRFGTADNPLWTDDGYTESVTVKIDGVDVTTVESFKCYWDTHEIYGDSDVFELKKTFKHLVALLASNVRTGCRIWARIEGIWEVVFDYDVSANYFSFADIDFSDFSLRTDTTPTIVGGKFKAKNLLHTQFRFENSKPQPFGVYAARAKYSVGSEYRK